MSFTNFFPFFRLREKFRQKKEKRQIDNKLKSVKGLGESDDFDDINAWIEHSREKEKSKFEAQKRAQMLEEMDAEFTKPETRRPNYGERNLKGLKVGHSVDSFGDGRTVILTLKDHDVLAEDDDELVNVNMMDDERYKKVRFGSLFSDQTTSIDRKRLSFYFPEH